VDASNQFTALSDPTRRLVFELVRTAPRAVGELADLVPVSRPAVSQHLRVLAEAGLVSAEQRGTRRIYTVEPEALRGLRNWVESIWEETLDAFEGAARKENVMPTTEKMIPPVVKSRVVPIPIEEAFELFTRRIGEWWPVATHSILGAEVAGVRFEEGVGGRVVEVATDAKEHSWADVLAWDPPHRFVLSWHPNPNPVAASTLEVRFVSASGGTEITLEHRGWEEFGDSGEGIREDYQSGWDVVLTPFEEAAGSR
jgi:DNA-binding transcriptional ArsR family regulator